MTQIGTLYLVAPSAYLDSNSKQKIKRFTLKRYLFPKAVNAIIFFRTPTFKSWRIGINYFRDSDATTFSSLYFLHESWTIYFYYHVKKTNDLVSDQQKYSILFPKQKCFTPEGLFQQKATSYKTTSSNLIQFYFIKHQYSKKKTSFL